MFESARRYRAASNELGAVCERLNGSVDSTVGGTWVGAAGTSCRQAVGMHGSEYTQAGGYAEDAALALSHCANRWQAALADYDRARALADDAITDEIQHQQRAEREAAEAQAAGDETRAMAVRVDAERYQSPHRFIASRQAEMAVNDFNAATRQCCGKLDSLMGSVKLAVTWGGLALGTGISGAQAYHKYGSKNLTRTLYGGWRTPGGGSLPAHAWKPNADLRWVPGQQVPDQETKTKWGVRAKWLGRAGYGLSFATAGTSQWVEDGRKYPAMETDERVSRAVAQGLSTGVGGALAGAAAGAAVGSVVPVFGTAVGFVVGGVVGYFASRGIDQHNDWFVDGVGNLGDETGDRLGEAWDAIR